jgi:hypothetical protein
MVCQTGVMRQLLYVSTTSHDLGPEAVNAILTSARANNAMLGITGLLLYVEGGFLQLLEGDELAVRELYMRIAADRRHLDTRVMLDREATTRSFPGWAMGFECPSLRDPETAGMFGVVQHAIQGRLSGGAGKVVALMLETFYRVHCSEEPLAIAS